MEENKILKLVYTFFLGVLLAIFVGVGINTFYPGPQAPDYPVSLQSYSKEMTDEQIAEEKTFQQKEREYQELSKPYSRNVSMIALAAGVIFLAISLMYEKRIKILADGVLLGGLFSLIYSIGRGFASEDSKYVFVVVSIGLLIVIYLGYHRFVKPNTILEKNLEPKPSKSPKNKK